MSTPPSLEDLFLRLYRDERASAPLAESAHGPYAGLGTMVRLALRRDRVLIPLWALILSTVVAGSVGRHVDLYPDSPGAAPRRSPPTPHPRPASCTGPSTTRRASAAWPPGRWHHGGGLRRLLAMTVVRRHTRTDEEAGRLELVTAGLLGKRATLTAGVIVAVVACWSPRC